MRYHNLIVNASRLAAYETDIGAIPAKAAGELVGEDWAAQAPQGGPGATKTGLQGLAAPGELLANNLVGVQGPASDVSFAQIQDSASLG